MSLSDTIHSQIDVWWFRFRKRLDGMTDDELWWEPAPECWTLRRAEDGEFHYGWPPGSERGIAQESPPFTTIAWRLAHLAIAGMAGWALGMEGDTDAAATSGRLAFPAAADEAVAFVELWHGRWRAALGDNSDEDLWRPIGKTAFTTDAPTMKLGRDDPFVNHVLHQHREMIHHGAEVALLRDLFAARSGTP
jgi:hypothetical protein